MVRQQTPVNSKWIACEKGDVWWTCFSIATFLWSHYVTALLPVPSILPGDYLPCSLSSAH